MLQSSNLVAGVGVTAGAGVGGVASSGAGGSGHGSGVSVVVITGDTDQTDLSSGSELLVGLISLAPNNKQADMLDLLACEGNILPAVVIGPFAGGEIGVCLAVGADLNLVLKDGTIVCAGTGLVVQTGDLIVLGQLEVEPEVLGIGARPGGVPHGAEVVIQSEICIALSGAAGLVAADGGGESIVGNSLGLVQSRNDFLSSNDLAALGALHTCGLTIGADGGCNSGDLHGDAHVGGGLANQTHLVGNSMTGITCHGQQSDIRSILQRSLEHDFLPVGSVSPVAGNQILVAGAVVVADGDLVLGDVTVAGTALVTQSSHLEGTIDSKVDPAVFGSVLAVTTAAGIVGVPLGFKIIVQSISRATIVGMGGSIVAASGGGELLHGNDAVIVALDGNAFAAGNDSATVGTLHTGSRAGAVQSSLNSGDLFLILMGMVAQNLADREHNGIRTIAAHDILAAQVVEVEAVHGLDLKGTSSIVLENEDAGIGLILHRGSAACKLGILTGMGTVEAVAAVSSLQGPDVAGIACNSGGTHVSASIQTGKTATGIHATVHATVAAIEQLIFRISLNFRNRLTEDIHSFAFSMSVTHGEHTQDHHKCQHQAQETLKVHFHFCKLPFVF